MKSVWWVLLMFIFFMSLASASVEVNNLTFKTSYSPYESISGKINLTIIGENLNSELRSSNGDSISLGKFLEANGVNYRCSPPDCSVNYNFSSASEDKTFSLGNKKVYGGFVLKGSNVKLNEMNFSIGSNFGRNVQTPLSIDYFGGPFWKFNNYSDVFSLKSWGCYKGVIPTLGSSFIGKSKYCEMIPFSRTNSVIVGALLDNGDNRKINMTIFPKGWPSVGTCSYNPEQKDSCRIKAQQGSVFEAGQYEVCISADETTNYKIYQERGNSTCGFIYSYPNTTIKDYAIFAQTARYANASLFSSADVNFAGATSAADNFILEKYGRNCSKGCVLPITFIGIPQEVRIHDVVLQYVARGENKINRDIYDLKEIPTTVDFSGLLDLSLTGFNISKSGNYSLYLGNKSLFRKEVKELPAPIINSFFPKNPPAGVPIKFHVSISYPESNASLTYTWKFGNEKALTSSKNFITHTFNEIKNYDVDVEVSAGGNSSSKKSFKVNTISPVDAINISLSQKTNTLKNLTQKINGFPAWYGKALSKVIKLSFYNNKLDGLKEARDRANNGADFLEVAKELYALNIPVDVFADTATYPFLSVKSEDIHPRTIINAVGGSSYSNLGDYKNPILRWQTQNIRASYFTKTYLVSKWDGSSASVFSVYSFNVNSSGDETAYFVINRPKDELYFNKLLGAQKVGNSTVIIFKRGENKKFEFYYESPDKTSFFISPKLSSMIIKANIDTTCNHDNICEKNLGENPNNCPSDCKPVKSAVVRVILAMVFMLIFYTILQFWYERHYEGHLFKDRRELYNIVMYITNARARGQSDGVIIAALRKQGWSGEKISYVIRKSRGQRTGLPEIIPFGRVGAYSRNQKARKKIATEVRQQDERKINKSAF